MASISVLLTDATGSKEQDAIVPDDAPSIQLISRLIQVLGLPLNGPDQIPLAYKFQHRSSGKQLRDDDTLASAGVVDGDTLRLVAEITAG
jgi:uncharacterized ubiquitin-like protein YukD